MPARGKENGKYQGSKWITRERRLAIYIRDGLACVYCGATLEEGAQLSLDHVIPHSQGGTGKTGNLVTACRKCNSARGDRSLLDFCVDVAIYLDHDITSRELLGHIKKCQKRSIDIPAAKEIIARRGSWSNLMKEGI